MKTKIEIKKETIIKMMAISLFWGSLWGIAEATLGYLVHLVTFIPGLAGFIMFPIGFYFMDRAYKESGKYISLLSTSAVAATIKLMDLFLPGLNPIFTINPAMAILMEGALLMIAYKMIQQSQRTFRFREALMAAAGWRATFILYSLALMALSISDDFFHIGIGNILRFFILESLVNALFITAYLKTKKNFETNLSASRIRIRDNAIKIGLSFSIMMFAIAILTRIILWTF